MLPFFYSLNVKGTYSLAPMLLGYWFHQVYEEGFVKHKDIVLIIQSLRSPLWHSQFGAAPSGLVLGK